MILFKRPGLISSCIYLLSAALIFISWPVIQEAYGLDSKYKVILDKNPFDPDRGSGNKEEGDNTTGAVAEFASKYAVYGVVIAQDRSKWAFIKPVSERPRRETEDDGLRKVTEGDLVDGWRVTSITSEGVYFNSGKNEIFLRVFGNTKNERSSNKPVGIATPKPKMPSIYRNSNPVRTRRNNERQNARSGYLVAPVGKEKDMQTNNPFLKALMDARKKQRGTARQENSR